MSLDEFFLGPFQTAMEPDEILVRLRRPPLPAGAGGAYASLEQPASGYSLVGIAAVIARSATALSSGALRSGSNKKLLRLLYDDGLVTGSYLSSFHSINDRVMSIELAILRSPCPADTLQQMLVPEYLSPEEFRTLFRIPWSRKRRALITSNYLISKMPLVKQVLNQP